MQTNKTVKASITKQSHSSSWCSRYFINLIIHFAPLVSHLFSSNNFSIRDDEDLEISLHLDGLSVTVRATWMINIACQPSSYCSIHYTMIIQPEHVDSSILWLVSLLPYLGKQKYVTDEENYWNSWLKLCISSVSKNVEGIGRPHMEGLKDRVGDWK